MRLLNYIVSFFVILHEFGNLIANDSIRNLGTTGIYVDNDRGQSERVGHLGKKERKIIKVSIEFESFVFPQIILTI